MWIRAAAAGVGAAVFCLLTFAAAFYHPGKLLLQTYKEFSQYIKVRGSKMADYQKLERFLRQNGALFHYGMWIEPIRYMALRLIAGAMGLLAGSGRSIGWGIAGMLLLYHVPGWLLVYLNSRDNERMLPELKLVYHALAIQIKAGVYVTDALAECYGSVQEPRLRKALMELSGDIVMKADIEDALERFQGKFNNQYIDSLCITILQALESGQAVELLQDIAEQIKDMETAVLERRKAALDRSITFYQLGILAAILVVVIYTCITHMFSAALRF